ncbi:hypothetical protein EJB05_28775, partial [Eragrostis curvula]
MEMARLVFGSMSALLTSLVKKKKSHKKLFKTLEAEKAEKEVEKKYEAFEKICLVPIMVLKSVCWIICRFLDLVRQYEDYCRTGHNHGH